MDKNYDVELWIQNYEGNEEIEHRTNNALESFNRKFNENFSNAHPNLANFIEIIKQLSKEYVTEIKDVKTDISHFRKEKSMNETS
jgi:hypothetical protein